jgi:hypothetical protein
MARKRHNLKIATTLETVRGVSASSSQSQVNLMVRRDSAATMCLPLSPQWGIIATGAAASSLLILNHNESFIERLQSNPTRCWR